MCDVCSLIQHCHRLGYEENNGRSNMMDKMNTVFLPRGYRLSYNVALLFHTQHDLPQKSNSSELQENMLLTTYSNKKLEMDWPCLK